MAEVFEAFVVGDRGFERRVALKRLLPGHAADDAFVRAFIDEARIVSQLHHASIVSVFDFGVLDDEPFLVSEWVDGVDLARLAELAGESGARMPVEIALRIATEVAYALAYAHEARDVEGRLMNIVHRDVSPENILVSWEGDIKLADFGIARAIRRLEETRVGVTKGKLGFMAPEQIKGQDV